MSSTPSGSPKATFSEPWLLFLLAAIQFTLVVDFMIIMPLGPQYQRVFHIDTAQFGIIVSAYAISAGVTGLLAGVFLDRFDRRAALLWLYFGFTVGTLLCAVAPTYPLLVGARVVAGGFGGVTGALILAIIGDVIPHERRGAAMGRVMSSFSVASVFGVPMGLFLASHFSWHVPFFAIAGVAALILLAGMRVMPSLRDHLRAARDEHPVTRMLTVLMHKDHRMAFVFMSVLTLTGFMIFPYVGSYLVANVGLTEQQLPWIYVSGGACTIFSMNWIGRWADRAGKHRVFILVSLAALVPILAITNLPPVPVWAAVAVFTVFMIAMSGRMVPAMALMTGTIEARYRGGFMSLNSAVQQFSCGLASLVSGHILGQTADGALLRFKWVGALSVAGMLTCIYLARYLKTPPSAKAEPAAVIELLD